MMADGFKMVRKNATIYAPPAIVGDAVIRTIADVAAASIPDNILKQRQADGSRIRVNKPATRRRKRLNGRPMLSLIDEKHRFIQGAKGSFKHEMRGTKGRHAIVIKPATKELATLSRHVQQMGYTGWFGLSKQTIEAIRELIRQAVKKTFADMRRRGRR